MGLVLDTSLFIRAERQDVPVIEAIESWLSATGEVRLGVSAITLTELAHGVARANSEARRSYRSEFIRALRENVPV